MKKILIISDSRGRQMNRQLRTINWHLLGFVMYILFFPGATIQKGITKALKAMSDTWFDIIYIHLGVNNLSTLISPRNILPIYTNRYALVKYLTRELFQARYRLRSHTNKIIICELIGLNYEIYNLNSERPFYVEQTEINSGMILLNQYIRESNNNEGLFSPHLENFTHKQRKERDNLVHRYSATTRDGIHFTDDVSNAMLDRFIIATLQQI